MNHWLAAALCGVLVLGSASVQAAEQQPAGEGFGDAAVVADQTLATERAMGANDAAVSCDLCSANGVSTISNSAFQNATGVFTVVQNTGNQVFMDTVTVVNVTINK